MKTGIIDVGGGMRGIYAAGVFDRCLDTGVHFDICIGVSAGSANGASFVAGQKKRNYAFYTEYAFRKEYMSLRNFVTKKSYIDLDYVYGTLSNTDGEYPLDYDAFAKNPTDYVVVATDAATGKAVYFNKTEYRKRPLRCAQGIISPALLLHALFNLGQSLLRRRAGGLHPADQSLPDGLR